jgi:glycosyltransferase involved in cell wall biosynthesis
LKSAASDTLVSAALIVRDEERHLWDCLWSIRDLVDEIVVVDTGSTDETSAIARRLGVRVHEVAWRDDFAAARNVALDSCRGEWILYIDADERVRPGSAARVRGLLRRPSLVGCYVWLHAHAGHTAYREMRLFRNRPRIRFEGVIHENMWPGILRHMAAEGGTIGHTDLTLDHVGYHGDQGHKHRRNLPLLLRKLEEDPDHPYSWWHLGAVYRGLGEPDRARAAWRAGVAAARRKRMRRWADSLTYIGLIELDFAQREEVDPLLEEALRRYPDHPHLVWLHGQALIRDGRFADAIPVLEDLVAWRSRPRATDGVVGADERLFSLLPYDALAACHYRLGRYAAAQRYFALAERCDPDRLEYRVKRELCARLAQRRVRPAAVGEPTAAGDGVRAATQAGCPAAISPGRAGSPGSACPSSDDPCRAPSG